MVRNFVFLVGLYLVLFPTKAHAYLDPGTGSYLIQVVAATLFAGIFLVKNWWTQISKAFFQIKNFFFDAILRKDKKPVEKRSSKNKAE